MRIIGGILIVFAFFLSINSSFAYKLNVLPSSFCNKLYEKLNLGEIDLTEKIVILTRYVIDNLKINELNRNLARVKNIFISPNQLDKFKILVLSKTEISALFIFILFGKSFSL